MNEIRSDRPTMITAAFHDRDSAERAYRAISDRGYDTKDVNVIMSNDTRDRYFGEGTKDTELGNKALEGAGAGAGIGGTLGAIAGAIAAVGTSLAIPGLGIIVAGPVAAALAGAGAGGATGGLLGALVGSGIPEDTAKVCEQRVSSGDIVMEIKPRSAADAEVIAREWRSQGGDVYPS